MHKQASSGKRLFFSLKWSTLLLLSFVLIVINFYFYNYHKAGLEAGFKADRMLELQNNNAQLDGLISQSSNYLQQIAEVVPSLYGMQSLLDSGDTQAVYDLFDSQWSSLQIQANIDTVGFYSLEGEAFKMWGDSSLLEVSFVPFVTNLLSDVRNHEKPITRIFCNHTCRQYAFVPVFSQNKQWGLTVVGRSLVESIISFSQISSVDIGILTTQNIQETKGLKQALNNWKVKVMAFSNYNSTYPVLQTVSEKVKFDSIASEGIIQKIGDKEFEIRSRHLSESSNVYVVFLEDISEPVAVINKAMSETLWTGIIGVLLAEIAILLILLPSLSSLKQTLDVIPLLAVSAFERARQNLSHARKSRFFKDEIDVLDDSIFDLATQLENLESDVAERSKALSNKMSELTVERDFIKRLLDTAQVIIVTQDKDGKILLVNQQVENVLGFTLDELINEKFTDFLCGNSDQSLFVYNLQRVSSGAVSK